MKGRAAGGRPVDQRLALVGRLARGGWLALAGSLAAVGCAAGAGQPPSPGPVVAGADTPSVRLPLEPCPPNGSSPAGPSPSPGGRLPDLRLACLSDSGPLTVDLARLPDAPTVVNLWASWCGPCQQELPAFAAVARRAGERVRLLGVQTKDDARNAADVLAAAGVHYPSLYDRDGRLLARLGVPPALPVTVFVRADGVVASVYQGPALTEQRLAALVAERLGVPVETPR